MSRTSLDDWREALVCYHAVLAHPLGKRVQRAPFGHVCSSQCPWFRHRQMYICLHSGFTHLCSEVDCDRLVETEQQESLVCSLLGLSYTVEMQATYEDGHRTDEQRRAQHAGDKQMSRTQREQGIKRDLVAQQEREEQERSDQFLRFYPRTLPDTLRQQHQTECFQWWDYVDATASTKTYIMPRHVLAWIYLRADGVWHDDGTSYLIEPCAELKHALPAIGAHPNVVESERRSVRESKKHLVRCMRQAANENM